MHGKILLSVQELRYNANKKSVLPSFLFFPEETVDKHSILTKAAIWIYYMHKAPFLSSQCTSGSFASSCNWQLTRMLNPTFVCMCALLQCHLRDDHKCYFRSGNFQTKNNSCRKFWQWFIFAVRSIYDLIVCCEYVWHTHFQKQSNHAEEMDILSLTPSHS